MYCFLQVYCTRCILSDLSAWVMAYMEAEDIILVMQGIVYGCTLQENKKNCMGPSEGSRQEWID